MSVTLKRTIKTYPDPIHYQYLKGYTIITGKSESKAVSEMIETFFETQSQEEKRRYLEASKIEVNLKVI
jgi:hypothetical protein